MERTVSTALAEADRLLAGIADTAARLGGPTVPGLVDLAASMQQVQADIFAVRAELLGTIPLPEPQPKFGEGPESTPASRGETPVRAEGA